VINLVNPDKKLTDQSCYGLGSGLSETGKGKEITLEYPFYIQDRDHMNALINASTQTNLSIDNGTVEMDEVRLTLLWQFVFDRVGRNVDFNVSKYDPNSNLFPSAYILKENGYDGYVCSERYNELIPKSIQFTNKGNKEVWSKLEFGLSF
jgi:hypothetical protein